ncbi:class I adenylate-forming enzyme family protein [Nonomuraea insulae]|uniref:Class I adenylate-forming enzyme family protein n=1 Tax=Nonomuraea insulae TaxID=1616787 RepID=A0ABW1DD43_9ACTN
MTAPADWQEIIADAAIPGLLARSAGERPDSPYCVFGGSVTTVGDLAARVREAAERLAARGVRRGDRVAVLLPNHPDHIAVILALIVLRATWLPVNPRLRGAALAHLLSDGEPALILVDAAYAGLVGEPGPPLLVRDRSGLSWLGERGGPLPERPAGPEDVVALIYTSGTTGPAKGVRVTDRMLRTSALGVLFTTAPRESDVYFLWEPLCHIGGAQMLLVPLLRPVSLAMVERFSVSRFWDDVRSSGATHVHQLGGILQLLLGRPPSEAEFSHRLRMAWGGGVTTATWLEAERRFGLRVAECYGQTEASSFLSVNTEGPHAGVGRVLPYLRAAVQDEDGAEAPAGEIGEIVVRTAGLPVVTPGYFRDDERTAAARRDGWWRTGDLGRFDEHGNLHFIGRAVDSVRRRGENVSAWEVETVFNTHPAVAESAMIGVPAEIGEQDIKVFIRPVREARLDAAELLHWCAERLADFQVPRYIAFVEEFPRTPSERVIKSRLPRSVVDCFDAERTSS